MTLRHIVVARGSMERMRAAWGTKRAIRGRERV